MKSMAVAFVIAAALVACGGKSKKATTPSNTNGSGTSTGSATGGTTYGGAAAPSGGTASAGGTADPCAVPQ